MKSRSAQTAAAIRTELKNAFPGIKFRVTSETYTGGSSVRIEYVDGVKRERVERVVCKYEQGRFDGMTDSYDYTNSRSDIPQVKYIFVERECSDETRAAIMSDFGFEPGTLNEWDADARSYRFEIVFRQFQQMQFGEHADIKNETELNAEREINGGLTNAELYAPKTEIVVMDEYAIAMIEPNEPGRVTIIKSPHFRTGESFPFDNSNEFRLASEYDFKQYDVDFTPYNDRAKYIFDDAKTPVMGSFNENGDTIGGGYTDTELNCKGCFGPCGQCENGASNDADVDALADAIGGDVTIKFSDAENDAITDLFDTTGRGNARVIDVKELNPEHLENIDPDGDPDLPTGFIGGNAETIADMNKHFVVWVNPNFRKS